MKYSFLFKIGVFKAAYFGEIVYSQDFGKHFTKIFLL